MASKSRLIAAMKAVPGTRGSVAPQASGMGRISPIASEMYYNNPYSDTYGPFLPVHLRCSLTVRSGLCRLSSRYRLTSRLWRPVP